IDTTFPLPVPEGYSLSISVAPDEFEPATFVLRANENLSGINIQVSPLVNGAGASLPSSAVDVRIVKTWYQPTSGNCTCDLGKFLIPELLIHDDALVKTDLQLQKSFLRATVNGSVQYIDVTTQGSLVPANAVVRDATQLQAFNMVAGTNKQIWL